MDAYKIQLQKQVREMLDQSYINSIAKIDKLINSGAIAWEDVDCSLLLPKAMIVAILESEADQYTLPKTYKYYRKQKKEIRNLRYFV